jgi:hypothetical protein
MRLINYLIGAIFFIGLLLTVSCSSQQYDPNYQHQLFVQRLQKAVGQGYTLQRNRAGYVQDRALLGETKLTSGHIVYKYRYIRTCIYMLEVDPASDIIVGADWEGEKGDCIHVP